MQRFPGPAGGVWWDAPSSLTSEISPSFLGASQARTGEPGPDLTRDKCKITKLEKRQREEGGRKDLEMMMLLLAAPDSNEYNDHRRKRLQLITVAPTGSWTFRGTI